MILSKRQLLTLILLLSLLFLLPVALFVAQKRQEMRGKAAASGVSLGIYPTRESFNINETKIFELKATFTNGSASEKLDYLKTELAFGKNYLKIPDGKYIDTSASGFDKIFRVDGPTVANDSGKIIIELGAGTPGSGPATDKPFTLAKIYLQGQSQTPSTQNVSIGSTQVVNNQTSNLAVLFTQGLSYTVGSTNPQTTATITDNFDDNSLDGNKWSAGTNNPALPVSNAVKEENGVLKIIIPSGFTQFTGAAVDTNAIEGDFEVSVDANIDSAGGPGADTNLLLHDDRWDEVIHLQLVKESGGNLTVFAFSKKGGISTQVGRAQITGTVSQQVTLVVKRIGSSAQYYYRTGGGNLNLVASAGDVYTGAGRLALTTNTGGTTFPAISSSFDNFLAKVNFPGVPTSTPTPTPVDQATCLTLPQSDTFTEATISAQLWKYWSHQAGLVNQNGGVLSASMPGAVSGFAGLNTKDKVCGDFDVRVDFSQFTSSGQAEGHVAMIILNEDNNAEVRIQRYSKDNEQGFWTDMKNPDGTYFGGTQSNSTATFGKLRIRRQGSVFATYYDDGSGWKKLGDYPSGFTSNANIIIGVGSWEQNPSVSANFDNFNLTQAIPDPTYTPVPTLSPTPTPPSGREKYTIDIGAKQWLMINIGPSLIPQIRFKARLSHLQNAPDMYLKLRVKDELVFMSGGTGVNPQDTCNNPPAGYFDFWIPVRADGDGNYKPVESIGTPPAGMKVAQVTPDGWVMLDGVTPGRYYTFYLKGPKTRSTRLVEHVLLAPKENQNQDFDWTTTTLDPGDLPDPNNGGRQDCTVNSVDLSLISSRLGRTDNDNLNIADVNYDSVVNSADISKVVNTLSTKPDDDQ